MYGCIASACCIASRPTSVIVSVRRSGWPTTVTATAATSFTGCTSRGTLIGATVGGSDRLPAIDRMRSATSRAAVEGTSSFSSLYGPRPTSVTR